MLLRQVRRLARARRLVLLVAGQGTGDGIHGNGPGRRLRSWAAHDRREALAGIRAGATILFVSPVFATRSHRDARPLGPARAARIGRNLPAHIIALGGMTEPRWRRIRSWGFDGWAAIDAWLD